MEKIMKSTLQELKLKHEKKLAACIRVAVISDQIGDLETFNALTKQAYIHNFIIIKCNRKLSNNT